MKDNHMTSAQSEQYKHYIDHITVSPGLHSRLLDIPNTITKETPKKVTHSFHVKWMKPLTTVAACCLIMLVLYNTLPSFKDKSSSMAPETGSTSQADKNETTLEMDDTASKDTTQFNGSDSTDELTASNESDALTDSNTEELVSRIASLTTNDYLICNSNIYILSNTTNYGSEEVAKDHYLGTVTGILDPSNPSNNTATTLPVGSSLYECKDDSSLIMAITSDGVVYYEVFRE